MKILSMDNGLFMHKFALMFILMSSLAEAGDIKKWVDEKGNVHYGDRPPAGQNAKKVEVKGDSKGTVKKDDNFLLGKWRTDPVTYNGQTIPSFIYVFEKGFFSVQGKTEKAEISYSYSNGVIAVTSGGFSQNYTVVDDNTVSYSALGLGKQLLHRIE